MSRRFSGAIEANISSRVSFEVGRKRRALQYFSPQPAYRIIMLTFTPAEVLIHADDIVMIDFQRMMPLPRNVPAPRDDFSCATLYDTRKQSFLLSDDCTLSTGGR